MFSNVRRSFLFLARTPLVPPQPTGPAPIELASFSSSSSSSSSRPSRPRAASRAISNLSIKLGYNHTYSSTGMQMRGYASDKGKQELYSDEAGSTGAGTDDVAHTDAAFDKNPNPESAAKGVEQESGKDFTNRTASNPDYSHPPGKQGEEGNDQQLRTSRKDSGNM